jgi:AcrR family transcriptional regulator
MSEFCGLANKSSEVSGKSAPIDPRVKRTRKLLQQALAELIVERDFQSITVQDIAARAEVNRATFYAHFEDKYALLNFSLREALREQLAKQLPESPTLTAANLRLLVVTIYQFFAEFYEHCRPFSRGGEHLLIGTQVQMFIQELLTDWMGRTPDASGLRQMMPETAASVASWVILGTSIQWSNNKRSLSADQVADQVLAFMTAGLSGYLEDTAELMASP